MAARLKQPPVNYTSKGAIACKGLLLDPANSIWVFTVAGALTDGTSGDGANWAGLGSVAIRSDTGNWYRNTNTKASPTWTEMSSA
jgi:hypothetical protein